MEIVIVAHAEEVIARFKAMPALLRQAMKETVDRLSLEIQTEIKENKLTGTVLHVRTGTLRRSINRDVQELPDGVKAIIYTRLNYGIYWEDGFDRRIGAGARGGPRTLQGAALDKYYQQHPPGVKHLQKPYMRPTLADYTPKIKEDIRAAALAVVHG